jgi:NAD(P)H dehydrogenase (quinone)
MTKVAIIYFSGSGHNHLMAEAVAAGAAKVPDTQVDLLRITGSQITEGRWKDDAFVAKLNAADAIIFGAATYMGGPASQFKAFADMSGYLWFTQAWKDKVAGGFTHSGTPSGDKQGTIQYFATLAGQHAMIWVTVGDMPSQYLGKTDGVNRLGGFLGAMGAGGAPQGQPAQIDSGDRLTAELYGKRVAEVAKKLRG